MLWKYQLEKKHDKAFIKPQHTVIPPTVAIAIMVLHLESLFEYGQNTPYMCIKVSVPTLPSY